MSAMNLIILKKFHWVPNIASWGEHRFSKLKILKKHTYLTSFSVGSIPSQKWGEIRVFFQNFEFWKPIFSLTSSARDPVEIFENNWVHCRHFGHLSLASDPFLKIPPSRKITNNSSIYTYLGGNMSRGGTARGKINNFFEAPRCIVFSKKKGHSCIHFLEKYWFFLEILLVVRYLK